MFIMKLCNLSIRSLVSFYIPFLKPFLTLQFNKRNTIYFKVILHFVYCLWNSLEWVWGSECAAGGFVVGVCVCVCVCVSALSGSE